MEYPIVAIAYMPTNSGDAISTAVILTNEEQNQTFINNYNKGKTQIKYRQLTNSEKSHFPRLSLRTNLGNNPIIPYPDHDNERLAIMLDEMYKRKSFRFIDDIIEYIGRKINDTEKIRLKLLLLDCGDLENKMLVNSDEFTFKLKDKAWLGIHDSGSYSKWKESLLYKTNSTITLAQATDKVLHFITLPEFKKHVFTEKELSEKLCIQYDKIEMVTTKMHKAGFVKLTSSGADGFDLHVLPAARIFIEEGKTFEVEEKQGQNRSIIDKSITILPILIPIDKEPKDDKKTNQIEGPLKKFWKFISENKLISTILAALIVATLYYFFFGVKPGSK
jgi:hypothetical protein